MKRTVRRCAACLTLIAVSTIGLLTTPRATLAQTATPPVPTTTDPPKTKPLAVSRDLLKLISLERSNTEKGIKNRALTNCPDLSLLLEEIPDVLNNTLSKANLTAWVTAELQRAAPRLRVVPPDEMRKRETSVKDGDTVMDLVQRYDDHFRELYIVFSAVKVGNGMTLYNLRVTCQRSCISASGITLGSVWTDGISAYYRPSDSPATVLKAALTQIVRRFGEAWSEANPVLPAVAPVASPSPTSAPPTSKP